MSKLTISTKLMNASIRVVSNNGDAPLLKIKDKVRNLKRKIDLVKSFMDNTLPNKILNDFELNRLPGYDITVTLDYPINYSELNGVSELCNLTINHHLGTHTVQLMKLTDGGVVVSYNTITKQHAHIYHWVDNKYLDIETYNKAGAKFASGIIKPKALTNMLLLPDDDSPDEVNCILDTIQPNQFIVEFENGATAKYYQTNGVYHISLTGVDGKLLGTLHGDYLGEHLENYEMLVTFCKELPDV